MTTPTITYRANPRYHGDGIAVFFGSSQDAKLLYDGTNNEWTVQTKDSGGAQTDRLRVLANADITTVELYNDDPGATGIRQDIHHDSASPAASDILYHLRIYGEDDGGAKTQYGGLKYTVLDPANASEDGKATIEVLTAGTLRAIDTPIVTANDTLAVLALAQTLTNKTLTTPTIVATGWTNANHAHAATNSGGKVGAGDLSGSTLASGVTASSLTSVGTLAALSMGGTLNMANNTLENIGAAGNQWTSAGLIHAQSADNIQDAIRVNNLNVGSSGGMRLIVGLADAAGTQGDSDIIYDKSDNTDGSLDTRIKFRLRENGANNEAVRFLSTGQIEADLGGGSGNVTIFDEWDDALVLRDWAHGSGGLLSPEQLEHNRELLCEAGVMSRKDTGSGYWLAFQPMMRLLAGGIYQTRAHIDALQRELGLLKALSEA